MNPNAGNPDRTHQQHARGATFSNPRWWNTENDTAWGRVKEAFRRDWEQTKADLTGNKKGRDLDQDVPDTVKQAVGKDPIPPRDVPNPDDEFARNEPAFRYGYGARSYYQKDFGTWDDRLETKLRTEWGDLKSGRTWDEVKGSVRRGWDYRR